jgi:hypothetical protein
MVARDLTEPEQQLNALGIEKNMASLTEKEKLDAYKSLCDKLRVERC